MAKLFLFLCCLSAGCFIWAEANPFFFNVQKSYVSQPTQRSPQTSVSQSADFDLGGIIITKWLAFKQIWAEKLIGTTTRRPRPTQRPVVQVQSTFVPVDLEKEKGSSTTTAVPAELIDSSTTTTTRKPTTDKLSNVSSTTDRKDTTSSNENTTPATTDRTTTTSKLENTTPSTTDGTTTTSATSDRDTSTSSSSEATPDDTSSSTADHTSTTFGSEDTTPSTTDHTSTTSGYEYTTPEVETIKPTTYRPDYRPTTTEGTEENPDPGTSESETSESGAPHENQIDFGSEDKPNEIVKPYTTEEPDAGEQITEKVPIPYTYFAPTSTGFGFDTESSGRISVNAKPFDIVSVSGNGNGQALNEGAVSSVGIDPRVFYYF